MNSCFIRMLSASAVLCALSSCKPSTQHEVIFAEKGLLIINLESKVQPDAMIEIIRYYYDDYNIQHTLKIDFCVPSEYPDYPEKPWAMAWLDGKDNYPDDPFPSVRIYGTRTESEKQGLLQSTPTHGTVLGKWYWKDPMQEATYILIDDNGEQFMLIFRADIYYESHWKGKKEVEESNLNFGAHGADLEDKLIPGNHPNEYFIYPDSSTAAYRIDEKGRLVLLGNVMSYKDLRNPVLEPIPFEK